MPKPPPRLSAVAARRRKLQHAHEQPTVAVNVSASIPDTDEVNETSSIGRRSFLKNIETKEDVPTDSTVLNQFSSLVSAGQVSFSSTREIEHVKESNLKIRLARSQKCVILGVCSLWIKEGTITVYGAVLSASTETYRVYAPNTHALPVIEAVTKSAEFELIAMYDELQYLPNIGTPNIWTPSGSERTTEETFYVLDYSFSLDPRLPNRFRELDLSAYNSILTQLSSTDQAHRNGDSTQSLQQRRILVSGKPRAGVSTFFRSLMNRMVTARSKSSNLRHPHGIIALDLESTIPEFTPPGSMALLHISRPVLGVPFSHQLKCRTDTSVQNRTVKMHFIGEHNHDFFPEWILERLLDLLEKEKVQRPAHHDCPLIINVPSWFHNLTTTQASRLWSLMVPTDVVFLDPGHSEASTTPWQSFIDPDKCMVHHIHPNAMFHKYNNTREHELQVQSWFHGSSHLNMQLQRDNLPILSPLRQTRSAKYNGSNKEIAAIFLLSDSVALEATYESLENNVVAVIAISNNQFKALEGHVVRTELGSLPRFMHTPGQMFPVSAAASSFVGMAYVHSIDIEYGQLWLSSTVQEMDWLAAAQKEQVLVLAIPKATTDGRFTSRWLFKEIEQAQICEIEDELTPGSASVAETADDMQLE